MTTSDSNKGLNLVGGLCIQAGEKDYAWFGDTFARFREVKHTGEVSRLIAFETLQSDGRCVRFFGMEVERIADIPQGLIAWELHDDYWVMWQSVEGGHDVIAWQTELSWQWQAVNTSGRWSGEFTARCPVEWGSYTDPAVFQMTANAYLKPHDQHFDDEILLVQPDPTWPAVYTECAAWLREVLGQDVALRIEHYGSTSIPGIPAKPVIDVLVEVPSFAAARQRALSRLNCENIEYWWQRDHIILIKRQAMMARRTHHVHLAPAGHPLWDGIAFRDYLIAHPDIAVQYATLKQQLAACHRNDREGYTDAKTDFVMEITARALNA